MDDPPPARRSTRRSTFSRTVDVKSVSAATTPSFEKMPVYQVDIGSEEDESASEEDAPSVVQGNGSYDNNAQGGSPRSTLSEREVTNLAQSVQRLLDGQQRMEQLLGRLTDGMDSDAEERAGSKVTRRKPTEKFPWAAADGSRSFNADEKPMTRIIGGSMEWLQELQMRLDLRETVQSLRLFRPSVRTEPDSELGSFVQDSYNDPGGSGSPMARVRGLMGALGAFTSMTSQGPTEKDKHCLVWSPTSSLRLFMDLVSVVVLTYDVLSLPYFLAFDVPQEGTVLKLTLTSVSFWIIDLFFRFRTGYWQNGHLEMAPAKIASKYLRTTFALDITLIMLDIAALLMTQVVDVQPGEKDAFKLWRLGKVTRILRCVSFLRLRLVGSIMERAALCSRTLQATGHVVYDVIKIIFVILWLNHIIACMWVALGRSDLSDTGISWLDVRIGGPEDTTYGSSEDPYQYTTAFHWALTQMTPGSMQVFPVNSGERIFNSICLIFGVLVFSTLISSISSTVTQFKISMQSKNAKMQKLNRFLGKVTIDPILTMQVRKQVQEKLRYQKPLLSKDVEVLELLPLSLQVSLQLELCRPHVSRHSLFNFVLEADILSSEELCQTCAEFMVLAKKDTLFLAGTEAAGMYFVTNGALQYVHTDSNKSRSTFYEHIVHRIQTPNGQSVEKGKWLSEAALWCNWRHVGNAEACPVAACEALCIQADRFCAFLKNRPGIVGQVTSHYALNFYNFLTASIKGHTPTEQYPTDLRVPFATDEIFSVLPSYIQTYMGRTGVRVLKTRMRSTRSILTSLSEGWPDVDRIREEVEMGTSTILLTKHDKFGVRCISTSVALKLQREDGRLLVALNRDQAEAKLPGLKQEEGEHPEHCFQRLLSEYFGPLAEGVIKESTEREDLKNVSDDLGITSRRIKVVFQARWEPPPTVTAEAESRRGSVCTDRMSMIDVDVEDPTDLVKADEVFQLPSGILVAWFTREELASCDTEAGRRALGQWLSAVSFPRIPSLKRRAKSYENNEGSDSGSV